MRARQLQQINGAATSNTTAHTTSGGEVFSIDIHRKRTSQIDASGQTTLR